MENTEITKSHLNNRICQHCGVKTSTVTPSFYYVFNISLSCNINIPSFFGNLWWVLLLGNHLNYSLYPVISDLKFPYPISFPSKYLASVLHLYPVKSDVVKLTFQIWYIQTGNRHWQRKSFQITSSFYLPQQDTKRPTTMKKKHAPFRRQYLVLFSRAFRRVYKPRKYERQVGYCMVYITILYHAIKNTGGN